MDPSIDAGAGQSRPAQDHETLLTRYNQLECRHAALTMLYVAATKLHESLDLERVLGAIREIVANLIGSEEFALYERLPGTERFTPRGGLTSASTPTERLSSDRGPIGRCFREKTPIVVPQEGERNPDEPVACIPLMVGPDVKAVIAIFRLLSHKAWFVPEDRKIFELLQSSAGVALQSAEISAQSSGSREGRAP